MIGCSLLLDESTGRGLRDIKPHPQTQNLETGLHARLSFAPACTEPEKSLCTWLGESCRQVESEEVSNSMNKIHQTMYKDFFWDLYITLLSIAHSRSNDNAMFNLAVQSQMSWLWGARTYLPSCRTRTVSLCATVVKGRGEDD